MATTQDGRLLNITTPKGKDFLLLNRISATEALSTLFSIEVELLHEENSEGSSPTVVNPNDILGKPVTITIHQSEDKAERTYRGIVNRFSRGDRSTRFSYYYATIVPNIWILTQNVQSRIFQHITVPDILKKVFAGFDIDYEIQGDFKKRNYCVQYRESDFDFASRLMEEEGIYYYFDHAAGSDKMVIANMPQSHRDCPTATKIPYFIDLGSKEGYIARITNLTVEYQLQTGQVAFWDYHFQLPTNKLKVEQPSRFNVGGNQQLEFYDYPGGYARKYDGINSGGGEQPDELNNVFPDKQKTAEIVMQALDAQYEVLSGSSTFCGLSAGHKFELIRHPSGSLNRQYVLTSVTHQAEQSPDYVSDEVVSDPYMNDFTCIPHGDGAPPYRPLRKTQKPTVIGSQTAAVVGPSGEEIFTDKYGRVKVQLHWDREGKNNSDSSCWLRVATNIAGNKWGTMYIPRIGQEVIVDFLEGDPDQPIIVGSVYNPQTMPHYELPKYKTLTYIKTRTSPDDGKGFNELRFEDKQGKEQVFVHSQKRMDVRVRQSLYETCGGNRQEVIGVRTDNNPGGNLAITVGGNYDLHVKDSTYIGIDGKLNEYVKGEVVEDYQSSLQTMVKSKAELNARTITLEALTNITLKVGGNFITIDPSGVTISGFITKINSGGAATGTSPATIDDPLDAEAADTGEPGYLDRPRTGGGKGGRNRRTLNGQHSPDATKVNDLINQAKKLEAEGKTAEAAAKKQEAIDEAIKVYNIDTSKTKSVTYDPAERDMASTSPDGDVTVGDGAFRNPAWLGSTIGHESEVHVNEQGAKDKWYEGEEGTAVQEVQAYDYEIANAERYGTNSADLEQLKRARQRQYNKLSDEYKQRVDGNPPNYDMKPGDEAK